MAKRAKGPATSDVQSQLNDLIDSAAQSGRVCLNVYEWSEEWVVIEGNRESLAFLGELLTTFARQPGAGTVVLDSPEAGIFHPSTRGQDGWDWACSHGIIIHRKLRGAKPMPGRKR